MGQEICDGSGAPGAHCRPAVVIEGEKRQDTHYFTSQILVFVNNHSDFWEKKKHVVLFCLFNNDWERWQIDIGC